MTKNNTIIIAGEELATPLGLNLLNFHDPEVASFESKSRKDRPVTELILHESVTRSVSSTVKVLQGRKLGVHLMVGPDGHVTQHGDLLSDRFAHAGDHNAPSIGVEIVNPYEPRHLNKEGLPWKRLIEDAPWAHRDSYVLPTPEQAEAVAKLVGWLTSSKAIGLDIPRTWIGFKKKRMRMGLVKGADKHPPGIYAHHYFAHADGAWPALYAWLRLEAGLPPCLAYEEAVRRATGARRYIKVSDLL